MPEELSPQTEGTVEGESQVIDPPGVLQANAVAADATKVVASVKKPRKIWPFVVTGVIIALGLAAYFLNVPSRLVAAYNTTSATLKIKETDKFAVEGAVVTLDGKTYTSDATGKVSIPSIVAGSYPITITKEGYQAFSGTFSVVRKETELKVFSLTPEAAKLSSIKGVITHFVTKLPLAGVQVTLGNSSVSTDAAGEYQFSKLALGKYTLSFAKTGFIATTKDQEVGVEQVTSPETFLTPAGKVFLVSNRSGKRAIYQSNLDGSELSLVTEPVGATEDFSPKLSPNFGTIAFSSTRDEVVSSFGGELSRMYVVGANGKNLKKVSDDYAASSLKWSPDSNMLFFSAFSDTKLTNPVNRFYNVAKGTLFDIENNVGMVSFTAKGDVAAYTTYDGSLSTLRTVNPNTGERKVITEKQGYIDQFSWSDANTSLTYSLNLSDGSKATYKVTVSNLAEVSLNIQQTASTRNEVASPDGKYKIFVEERDGKRDIYRQDADGKNEKKITSLGVVTTGSQLQFDATGEYIIFEVVREQETALYVTSRDGGNASKITDFYKDPNPAGYAL
jgi:Tol biopolymer transport system component